MLALSDFTGNERDFHIFLHRNEKEILNSVEASIYQAINRYHLREGKIYGDPRDTNVRFKIIRISGDNIVYKNLKTNRVDYEDVNDLLETWNKKGYKEISNVDSVLALIKKQLTPILGTALVALLITWISGKL